MNYFRMGYDAFHDPKSVKPEMTAEQAAEWKRGWDLAVHRNMQYEYRQGPDHWR